MLPLKTDLEEESLMAFNDAELAFMRSQPLARIATIESTGQPDVVPVAFEFDGSFIWVGGGATVIGTRKFRNVRTGSQKVALVIDDMVSFDPYIARGLRVYGNAEQPFERVGMVGPGVYMRITPVVSWSWNMAGEPVGDTWYESRRADHAIPQ